MIFSYFSIRARYRLALVAMFGLCLLVTRPLHAAPELNIRTSASTELELPEQYGEIIYQSNPAAPTKIFIIANGHRSAVTGVNAAKTVQAQIETFRIGEWLIAQNRIELLLPEGFFGAKEQSHVTHGNKSLLDDKVLKETLSDTSTFVNAELLLHESYGIGLDQIEDRNLYSLAKDRLRSSLNPKNKLLPAFSRELAYLQKLRTATLLQSVPTVIETAYQQGRISAPNAMMTIGMTHLDDLIGFLKAGAVSIANLKTTSRNFPGQHTKLALREKPISVTVIVPRILIGQQLLQLKL